MKRLALCLLVSLCSACSFKGFSSRNGAQAKGTREFKIDSSKAGIVVSLFGVAMGTPDGEVISSILEMAQADGTITKSIELAQAIEGGLNECLEAPDGEKRQLLLNRLQKVQTNIQESNYIVESVTSCAAVKDQTN